MANSTTEVADEGRPTLADLREVLRTEGPAAAERLVIDYLKDDPRSYDGFLVLGRLLLMQDQDEDAVRAMEKAKSLAPLEAAPNVLVGVAQVRLGNIEAAGAAFADAIRLDPSSARAHLGAAAVKMASGSYSDALELCDKVLDLDPSMERAQELIARINYKMGDSEAALGELRRLIENNPQNRRALYAYIGLMRSEGRNDEMLATLEADAEANPGDRRRENRFSVIAARAGRPELAVNYFRKLVEQNGSSKAADTVRYAMALIAAGETDKASAMIRPLEKRRATRPIAMKLDGDIALKAGEFERAVEKYRSACVNARCPFLDAEAEDGAADASELAGLWRLHTSTALTTAFKALRDAIAANRA